jgi:hydroxylamine reductase
LKLAGFENSYLEMEGRKYGLEERKQLLGDDYVGLQEMALYGLKGMCAYAEHATCLDQTSENVHKDVHKILAGLAKDDSSVEELLATCMEVGKLNLEVLGLLDNGHVTKFGHPEPSVVDHYPAEVC